MSTDTSDVITRLRAAAAHCARFTTHDLSDDELLDLQGALGAARIDVDAAAALLAAEISQRSRRELGYEGLAQRRGLRTAEALVQHVSGSSIETARRLVRVGTVVAKHADDGQFEAHPWLQPAAESLVDGRLSVERVDAIRSGVGRPTAQVTEDALRAAVAQLVAESPALRTPERLEARAREIRDALDEAGVADREAERRDRRYLRLIPLPDGMTRLSGLLDPESAAIVTDAVDLVTAPRRGGPRFVHPDAIGRAEAIVADERTTEQLALDALLDMVRLAGAADDGRIFGNGRLGVRVLVTADDLDRRRGIAAIEGQSATVSTATAERVACATGALPIMFDDDGQAVNVGRAQRRFTQRQRAALAARDGGCLFPECERPPSWTEAHHILEWSRGGRTDLRDGVLLCRHHHLLVHNNGWSVIRERGTYWLIPPPEHDPARTPIELRSRSVVARRLKRAG